MICKIIQHVYYIFIYIFWMTAVTFGQHLFSTHQTNIHCATYVHVHVHVVHVHI